MPRHRIQPLPRALNGRGKGGTVGGPAVLGQDEDVWSRMDRVQVLGGPPDGGHRGCVNALSWSDDGATLLSGSDDKRICIWAPNEDAPSDTLSPHPMKLKDTIVTGHRANIFSAKYLPNTSTPKIVSCAGDRDIRVFEVERLGRTEVGAGGRSWSELWGGDGDGVTVLRCHHDRTKRIATETSPFLFLTVSEDGTVRQHDLRRPHQCKSECPEPLFRAPRGVDLYSLSVSTVAPHTFAVAGRTDCAFVCDRRMLERHTPSWGPHTKASGQVHCVRRLGLSEDDWKSVEPRSGSMYSGERHITCVKMSPERADEVICAFARHSTSLFSLYDSPGPSSIRQTSASSPIATAKRRKSPLSASKSLSALRPVERPSEAARAEAEEENSGSEEEDEMERELEATFQNYRHSLGLTSEPAGRSTEEWAEIASRSMGMGVAGRGAPDEGDDAGLGQRRGTTRRAVVSPENDMDALETLQGLLDEDEDDWLDEDDMGGDRGTEGSGESGTDDDSSDGSNMDPDEDDLDIDEDMVDDDDDGMDLDEDHMDIDMDLEGDEDDDGDYLADPRSSEGEFGSVPLILPRRSYFGARNVETVKDCNFLGTRADKVCSGSDDGSWFVWDRDTGRLEGLWEGDGDVVNVMEQHPTLPIVAVSGIDNTVKLFAPPAHHLPTTRSFSRMARADEIIARNRRQQPEFRPSSTLGHADLLRFLQSRGIVMGGGMPLGIGVPPAGEDEDEEEGGRQECATQ